MTDLQLAARGFFFGILGGTQFHAFEIALAFIVTSLLLSQAVERILFGEDPH